MNSTTDQTEELVERLSGEEQVAAELREIAAEMPCCQRQMHLEIAAQIVEQGQFTHPDNFGFQIALADAASRLTSLEQENEALRMALTEIGMAASIAGTLSEDDSDPWRMVEERARTALQQRTEG